MGLKLSWIVGAGLLFLLIFLSGFRLKKSEKPYNTMLLTFHKLFALAAAVLFVFSVLQVNRTAALNVPVLIVSVVTLAFFLDAIVTGGLVSMSRPMPKIFLTLHRIIPYLIVSSAALAFYLIFRGL